MQSEKVIKYIVTWMKRYAESARMEGFVVGVSGGVDSALVSTLSAMTGMKTLVLEMPIRQKEDQVSRAKEHIEFLKKRFSNVISFQIDLTFIFDTFHKQVDVKEENLKNKQLSLANLRSRLRMVTLYYYAQIYHLLVTGTGNKIEDFGIGFFTKYGDGGVDISPIADLLKTEIYEIVKYIGIVESIQKASPTDGLWDVERTDEQQIGASYLELEWAMSVYKNNKADNFTGRKKEVFQIYDKLHKSTLHKINPIPVCKIPKELLK